MVYLHQWNGRAWRNWNAFALIAARGSFRRAAGELGMAPSTLSHMMKTLERRLDRRLLHRTTRSVALTETGQRFLARMAPLLVDFDQAFQEIGDAAGRPAGHLRLNAPQSVARDLILTLLPRFMETYPDIEVDLASEGRLVDIVEHGFDAGIRLGEAVPRDMNALRFGPQLRFIAVASPDYLGERSRVTHPHELARHACIRLRLPSGRRYQWEFARRGENVIVDVPGRLTLNDPAFVLDAARRGLGIAYVMEREAAPDIARGALVPLLLPWCPFERGLFVYYSGHRHVPPVLRAFLDFVKGRAATGDG